MFRSSNEFFGSSLLSLHSKLIKDDFQAKEAVCIFALTDVLCALFHTCDTIYEGHSSVIYALASFHLPLCFD